jgi:RNA recognition motif-containing protein
VQAIADSTVANRLRSYDLLKGGSVNIYVGNLSLETTEDELRKEFIAFGVVTSVTIMNDKYIGSGQPIGYGYVEMALKSEGMAAIAGLAGKKVRGQLLSIVEALPLSDKKGIKPFNLKNQNRSNKSRRRQFQII